MLDQLNLDNYKDYLKHLSKNDLNQVLNSIDQDKYPERYNAALQAYKSAKPDNFHTPKLSEKMAEIEKGPVVTAVFIGSSIDIIGGIISEFFVPLVISISYAQILNHKGFDPNMIGNRLLALFENPYYFLLKLATVSALPFIAGMITAKIAKRNAVRCTIIVGILTSLIGLIIGGNANVDDAMARSIFRNIVSFVLILAGGFTWLCLRIRKGKKCKRDV